MALFLWVQAGKEQAISCLVKWLDCQQRLSLQVHLSASVASELGGEPKLKIGT